MRHPVIASKARPAPSDRLSALSLYTSSETFELLLPVREGDLGRVREGERVAGGRAVAQLAQRRAADDGDVVVPRRTLRLAQVGAAEVALIEQTPLQRG
ncbi:hypothetical protein ACWEL8_09365 [Streptomyces sp. NPDC004690]